MSTKIKTAMGLFFERYPEFSDATKEFYLHIERTQHQSSYFIGMVNNYSDKSGEDFFNDFYE
jgi:hypothetical protein